MKRGLCLMLIGALALLAAARAEGALCVVSEAWSGLVNGAGEPIVTDVDEVFCVREGSFYAAGSRGAYRLFDSNGNPVGEAEFAMVDDAGDCLIFRQGSLYGAMDEAGNVILPAAWTQLASDGRGGFLALESDPFDERPDAILHVTRDDDAAHTGASTASGLTRLQSGLMPVMTSNGRYGAINAKGEWAISPRWRYIGPFLGGRAKAAGKDGVGLIDTGGREIIPARYDWLERGATVIAAMDSGGVDVFSANGRRRLYRLEGEGLEAELVGDCLVTRDGKATQLYSASGAKIGSYDPDFRCAPGLRGQLIASQGAWGERRTWLMNADGSAASPRFQRILPLAGDRYAFVALHGIEYYSDDLDRVQTSWDYDGARMGLMDAGGVVIAPAKYRDIHALGADRLLMLTEDSAILADLDGRPIKTWLTAGAEAATGE